MKEKFNKEEAIQTFHRFMSKMDSQLRILIDVAEITGCKLGYSTDEFEHVELLFNELSTGDDDVMGTILMFSRYLGEIFRRNYGGEWQLYLENDLYFNLPVIIGFQPVLDLPFCPKFLMETYHIRRIPGLLRRAVQSHLT